MLNYALPVLVAVVIGAIGLMAPQRWFEPTIFEAAYRNDLYALLAHAYDATNTTTPDGAALATDSAAVPAPVSAFLLAHRDHFGNSALHWASKAAGNTAVMPFLLSLPHATPNVTNAAGTAPLHWAAATGDAAAVTALLAAGADVNAPSARQERPLHWAVEWLNVAAVRALLATVPLPAAKADSLSATVSATAAAAASASAGKSKSSGKGTATASAARAGAEVDLAATDAGFVMSAAGGPVLAAARARLNLSAVDEQGDTALHRVRTDCHTQWRCVRIVSLLLRAGAEMGAQNVYKRSPLQHFVTTHVPPQSDRDLDDVELDDGPRESDGDGEIPILDSDDVDSESNGESVVRHTASDSGVVATGDDITATDVNNAVETADADANSAPAGAHAGVPAAVGARAADESVDEGEDDSALLERAARRREKIAQKHTSKVNTAQ